MKIRVLGAFGGEGLGHRPSAFLVNDKILLDAGSVTGALTVPEQLAIEHALGRTRTSITSLASCISPRRSDSAKRARR